MAELSKDELCMAELSRDELCEAELTSWDELTFSGQALLG